MGTSATPQLPDSPTEELLRRAVELALHAPSVHNTQPWRWRLGDDHVELHADWNRHLIGTDPDRRDLVVSCGAALHHVRVALAGLGIASHTHRLPDPENSAHLATVHTRPGPPDPRDGGLMRSIVRRRTDRRLFSMRPVRPTQLRPLETWVAGLGAALHPVLDEDDRARIEDVLADAAAHQHRTLGYTAELAIWTRRYAGAHDGIPAGSRPEPGAGPAYCELGRFPPGRLAATPRRPSPTEDAAILTVITTRGDDMLDRIRAGEASSAVLLAATQMGLATTLLSQALEVAHTRHRVREDVLHTSDSAQLIIRLGWAPDNASELPETPRRRLEAVLLPPD